MEVTVNYFKVFSQLILEKLRKPTQTHTAYQIYRPKFKAGFSRMILFPNFMPLK
jgi:hypothetical protein